MPARGAGTVIADDHALLRGLVLDFGVTRLTDEHHDDITTLHSFHGFLGSLPYMSPLQASARLGDGDVRCDVYALGVITYE